MHRIIFASVVLCASPVPAQHLEHVAASRWQWTGIAVTDDHTIFVNYPRWSDRMQYCVARLDSAGNPIAFPDARWNSWHPGHPVEADKFVAVQSVVRDARNSLWVLDTGNPYFNGVISGAARLFEFNPQTGTLLRTYSCAPPAIKPDSYLNDVRIDLAHGCAYLTDSGAGALIVLDLQSGRARRLLDGYPAVMSEDIDVVIDGEKWRRNGQRPQVHADGIAYDAAADLLYFQALSGKTLYRIDAALLRSVAETDMTLAAALQAVARHGPVDGLIADPQGRIYLSNLEDSAIDRYGSGTIERMARDPLIAWPDSFSLTADGWLYCATSQIHRGDNPASPYCIVRMKIR